MHVLTVVEDEAVDVSTTFDCDLVIPALNEEARLGDTIASLHEAATAASLKVRYIVVDNGCVDATADIVDTARRLGRAHRAHQLPDPGQGRRRAGRHPAVHVGPFVGYCDADQSTPPSSVEHGLALLRSGWEVVVGSRRCAGAGYTNPQPASRRIGSFAFHAVATKLTGPDVRHPVRVQAVHRPGGQGPVRRHTPSTGSLSTSRCWPGPAMADFRMIELPIKWSDSEGSTLPPPQPTASARSAS